MKTKRALPICLLLLGFAFSLPAKSQSRVYEKDLKGEWKLITDLRQHGDSPLERALLKAVDGFVDEIDIRFAFRDDHQLLVSVTDLEDDEVDEDEAEWWINDDGQLVIGDSDQVDDEDVWMFKNDRLYVFDVENGKVSNEPKGVYLERVK